MAHIPFRVAVYKRLKQEAGDEPLGDYTEKLMNRAIKRLRQEKIEVYKTLGYRRIGVFAYNPKYINVSQDLYDTLKNYAHEAHMTLVDLCTNLAAIELGISSEEFAAMSMEPANRSLSLSTPRRDSMPGAQER